MEEARLQLSEAFLRFWEQADLVEDLLREQKPINAAKDLLDSLQVTLDELRRQVDTLEQGRAAA